MDNKKFKLNILSLALTVAIPCTFAATPIDISHQGVSYLQTFLVKPGFTGANKNAIEETKRGIDFNHTMHLRAQQTYAGFPVWGSHIAVHIHKGGSVAKGFSGAMASANPANTNMNGTLYQDLDKDLRVAPAYIFETAQAKKALEQAINLYQKALGTKFDVKEQKEKLMVYVDKEQKAHWAFYISLYGEQLGFPTIPTFIMDAVNFKVYKHWNDVKLKGLSNVKGGGFGGNMKVGKYVYDGDAKSQHLPALDIQRDNKAQICYLQNKDAVVINFKNLKIDQFSCVKQDPQHNNLYWNGDFDTVNGGYSPSNDALYAAKVVKDLYETWYKIPVLAQYEAPMPIVMFMHTSEALPGFPDQAMWDPWHEVMFFGDGKDKFYPLTSIDVPAHEISHGFTTQHSDLSIGDPQSGGLNEAFSDMAAQAAQYFVNGKADWKIAANITKKKDAALRYLDLPSKNCKGKDPMERCSLDNMTQYNNYVKKHVDDPIIFAILKNQVILLSDTREPDVHHSAGIYDRAFYLIANSSGWNIRKAFDVMVQANRFYWTQDTNFEQAACGVLQATQDFKYDLKTVLKAFEKVEIDTSKC